MYATDVKLIKQRIADHAEKSHKLEMPLSVSETPIKDFEEFANIVRVRNRTDILMLKQSVKSPQFWNTFRNQQKLAKAKPQPPLISETAIGEIKPF
jgi:hypothetical protein